MHSIRVGIRSVKCLLFLTYSHVKCADTILYAQHSLFIDEEITEMKNFNNSVKVPLKS